jgi:predicted Zn-dependent protease
MTSKWTNTSRKRKQSFLTLLSVPMLALLTACSVVSCSTNPATGEQQFTGLLPAGQEASIGAEEHQKVEAQFGEFMTGPIADYVASVGQRVAANTERQDVQYRFYTIDSPEVNAFALPGGYIYVTRGLLALANSEAELAAVLGHEIGHVTGRHAAARMSQGTLAGLGAAVVGLATGSQAAGQLANLGSNLYISSYSRGQEHQSDELGIRYLSRAGYVPGAMADFLASLDAQSELEGRSGGFSYFSTHPVTAERVREARAIAQQYPQSGNVGREAYLSQINGLTYGDSAAQGFVRNNTFYHPQLGFAFDLPQGTKVTNSPAQVTAQHPNGTVIIFDAVKDQGDAYALLTQKILQGQNTGSAERITVNGMNAATASFPGQVSGRSANIRVTVIEWAPGEFFRFQMAYPQNVGNAFVDELKRTTYSLRRLTNADKSGLRASRINVVNAPAGANVQSMASQMAVEGDKVKHFLVLNGLTSSSQVVAGQPYKIVVN